MARRAVYHLTGTVNLPLPIRSNLLQIVIVRAGFDIVPRKRKHGSGKSLPPAPVAFAGVSLVVFGPGSRFFSQPSNYVVGFNQHMGEFPKRKRLVIVDGVGQVIADGLKFLGKPTL